MYKRDLRFAPGSTVEAEFGEATAVELGDNAPGEELRAMLHEAINGLPRESRLAIVLCDLEGRSLRSTADQLEWPLWTLETRLVQARRRLQARLAQRGVFLSASEGIGEWLGVSKSMVSRRLIETTIQVVSRRYGLRSRVGCTTAPRSAEIDKASRGWCDGDQ
jgi:hypothetical protein